MPPAPASDDTPVDGGYAFRAGVTPGGEPLVLALQPAGHVAVHVLDPAGQPVKDAYPSLEAITIVLQPNPPEQP